MPDAFKKRFMPFKEDFLLGSTYPDAELKDFQNHVFHVQRKYGKHEAAGKFRDSFRGMSQ